MKVALSIPTINQYRLPFKRQELMKPAQLERTPDNDSFELSIGYVNDIHGQTNNMLRILSGIKGDLVLSGGDNDIGDEKNRPVHDATALFLNLAELDGTALGNHEMDTMQGDLKNTAKKMNGSIYAINLKQIPVEEQTRLEIDTFNKVNLNEFGRFVKAQL